MVCVSEIFVGGQNHMPFDPTNKHQKARLYRVLTAAAELTSTHFDDFLQVPFAKPWNLAPSSRRNLQRGEYSTIRAQVLYDYIHEHHFEIGHQIAPEIFSETPEMRWDRLLNQAANKKGLSLVPWGDLNLVGRFYEQEAERKKQEKVTKLSLEKPFIMELQSDREGYAVALQWYKDVWHLFPLGPNKQLTVPIKQGKVYLPVNDAGNPDPLSENRDSGDHQFAIVIYTDPPQEPIRSLSDLVKHVEVSDATIFVAAAIIS